MGSSVLSLLAAIGTEAWVMLGAALLGGGSIIGVFIKLVFSQREQASTAYISGHTVATEASKRELAALEQRFVNQLSQMREEHVHEITEMMERNRRDLSAVRTEVRVLRDAIIRFLPLVSPDKVQQAMVILAELNLATPTRRGDDGETPAVHSPITLDTPTTQGE